MSVGVIETLKRLAAGLPDASPKAHARGPHLLYPAPGEAWAAATDARGLLLVRAAPYALAYPDAPQKARDALAPFLAAPPGSAWEGPLSQLRSWCGPAVWGAMCPECGGASKRSDYVSCTFCDDDGTVSPEPRPGWLLNTPCDRSRLACLVGPFEGGPVSAAAGPVPSLPQSGTVLWVWGADWRAVLMGMTPPRDEPEWRDAPRFPEGEK